MNKAYSPSCVDPLPADTSWRTFARELTITEDLDSSYLALVHSTIDRDQMSRVVMGLMVFYQLGFGGLASEQRGADFWRCVAQHYPTAKRGPQRRHFRGNLGLNALKVWSERFREPEYLVDELVSLPPDFMAIKAWCSKIPQMGPYFTWKLADLYEPLSGCPIDWSAATPFAADYAKEGAMLLAGFDPDKIDNAVVDSAFKAVIHACRDLKAPPHHVRTFDVAEAETVCCFYKKLIKGKFRMGRNTAYDRDELLAYPCETNQELLKGMTYNSPFSSRYLDAVATAEGLTNHLPRS